MRVEIKIAFGGLLVSFLLGVVFILRIPPWNIPDEPTHLDYALSLAGQEDQQEEIIRSMQEHGFWFLLGLKAPRPLPEKFEQIRFLELAGAVTQKGKKPPSYYRLASLLLRVVPRSGPEGSLYLLRVFSLILHVVGGLFVFGAARRFWKGPTLYPLAAAGAFVLLPQSLLIGVSVSYEPLLDALSAGVFFFMVKTLVQGPSFSRLGLLFLSAFLAVAVSPKGLFLVPGVMVCLGISPWLRSGSIRQKFLSFLILAGITALALFLSWIMVAWFKPEILSRLAIEMGKEARKIRELWAGQIQPAWHYYPWFNREVISSFLFKAGWGAFSLPVWAFWIFVGFNCAAFLGQAPFLIGLIKKRQPGQVAAWIVTSVTLITVVSGYYLTRGMGPHPIPQGRHLLVGAPAWALIFSAGLISFFPRKLRNGAALGLLWLFILANIAILLFFLEPLYAQALGAS